MVFIKLPLPVRVTVPNLYDHVPGSSEETVIARKITPSFDVNFVVETMNASELERVQRKEAGKRAKTASPDQRPYRRLGRTANRASPTKFTKNPSRAIGSKTVF